MIKKILMFAMLALVLTGIVYARDLVQVEKTVTSLTAVGDPYGVKGTFGENGGLVSVDSPYGILGFEEYDMGSEEYPVGVLGIAPDGVGLFGEGLYGMFTLDDVFIGSDLAVHQDVEIEGDLTVMGESSFEDDTEMLGRLTVEDDATFESEVCIAQDGICLATNTPGAAKLLFDPLIGTGATMKVDTSGDVHIITHGEGKTLHIESYDGVGVGTDPDPQVQFDAANMNVNGQVIANKLEAEQVATSTIISPGDVVIVFGAG